MQAGVWRLLSVESTVLVEHPVTRALATVAASCMCILFAEWLRFSYIQFLVSLSWRRDPCAEAATAAQVGVCGPFWFLATYCPGLASKPKEARN